MIVTIEWMEEWFRRFDQEYFGGKLPVPELGLTHAKTRLGQLAYKRASRWGRTKLYDFKLSMSTYYDMTDKQAKSVLLHEMIHYIIMLPRCLPHEFSGFHAPEPWQKDPRSHRHISSRLS